MFCSLTVTHNWIGAAVITLDALFRFIDRHGNIKNRLKDKSVALILKKYIGKMRLDINVFSALRLRSGLATSAAMYGMTDIAIIKQTGHHTREMVDRYVQAGLRYKKIC
jgi:shikimate kinase